MNTTIKGIGVDVVDLERIRNTDERFAKRVLSPEEYAHYETIENPERRVAFLAGRFAVKEAFTKAWGGFDTSLNFRDVSVMPDAKGRPVLRSPLNQGHTIHVSITHGETIAIGYVLIEKGD